jgi:hypothetical protein
MGGPAGGLSWLWARTGCRHWWPSSSPLSPYGGNTLLGIRPPLYPIPGLAPQLGRPHTPSGLRKPLSTTSVTNLQGPPSERAQTEKLWDLKKLAQHYTRDRGSCDDIWISYLEFLELEADDDLTLAWMIAG